MSMVPVFYECVRCGGNWSSSVVWGSFSYVNAQGDASDVERTRGWCHACNALQPVESLDPTKATDTLRESNEAIAHYTDGLKGLLRRIWPSERARLACARERRIETMARLALLAQRVSPPRCLECGSIKVQALPSIDPPERVLAGMLHPQCGGEIWAYRPDLRYNPRYPPSFYDTEGNFLRAGANMPPVDAKRPLTRSDKIARFQK